ncbi:unnamed protein product [Ambrosiozyma monospora]|uniref:Unnamed protein product n=1 Tax=Ambrosiozyma monospora TaxID=43982 RepID=A0ACB5UCQ8_AMBMO|nr:unnamed protein product [Ambrosiozyma monospora]
MKGFQFLGPGKGAKLCDIDKPKLQNPKDVIGRIKATTICGSDHHLIAGFLPETNKLAESKPGRGLTLGHEGVIEIVEVGSEVTTLKVGDVCIVSPVNSCGKCYQCLHETSFACSDVVFAGVYTDGAIAEYIRIPFGERALYKAPANVPLESLVMLSDALPTSYEVGVEAARVQEGDRVAIIGCGPVGLSALLTVLPSKPSQKAWF